MAAGPAREHRVRLRLRESLSSGAGRAKGSDQVDDLFGGDRGPVRFVGDSGEYEPGRLAAKEQQKLPPEALAIVQQLVLWLPDDTRLYWQLGELYNAEADVEAAGKIFEECVGARRYDAAELREHRKLVQEARPKAAPIILESEETKTPEPPRGLFADSRQLLIVGGLAALVVLALAYFQIREMRRRRRA